MYVSRTLLGASLFAAFAAITATATAQDICKQTAVLQRRAAESDLKEELKVRLAICKNLTDPVAMEACEADAKSDFKEGKEEIKEQYAARLELCGLLGPEAYDPVIDPSQFTSVVDNPYLPWPVGAMWMYESQTDEGLEAIEITVLPETREILGVPCVTVRDVVTLGGDLVEDTLDWYAQDAAGNVWYFGETSFSFEGGYVSSIDGSWLAGVNGAKPGIVMLGAPVAGTTYRQEWAIADDAEDAGTVEAIDASVTIGLGSFVNCVQTLDFSPVEPDALEHKFFAPGIGFIFETKEGSTETLELVGFSGL